MSVAPEHPFVPPEGAATKDGAPEDEEVFPNSVLPPAFDREKLNAGVVVGVATLVVKSGDSVPAENDVTVPDPVPHVGQEITPGPVSGLGVTTIGSEAVMF